MAIRKTYSKAFKIEAVRLPGLGEKPAWLLVQELGEISINSLLLRKLPK